MHRLLWLLVVLFICSISEGEVILKRERLSSQREGVGGIRAGDRFYFAGGFTYNEFIPTDIIDVYNIKSGEWEAPLQLDEDRGFVSTAVIGDNIYFIGGAQRVNCTYLYNTTIHDYEGIGCGPTVARAKQISNHNGVITFLGSFSADFFNVANKQWYYLPALTSRMQQIVNGITVVHENFVIGIGGVNTTTLEQLFDAWIFDTQTNETTVFSGVTTTNSTILNNFAVGHGHIVIFTSNRYFVHQFGTAEWRENTFAVASKAVVLSDVIFVFNSTGFIIYDLSTKNETWTQREVYNIFSFDDQVVLNTLGFLLVYEEGQWTDVELNVTITSALPWFDNTLIYSLNTNLRLYSSQTKTIRILSTSLPRFSSIFAFNETLVVIFTQITYFATYDLTTDTLSTEIQADMQGEYIIGTDIISFTNRAVLINRQQRAALQTPPGGFLLKDSTDGRVILKSSQMTVYASIDIYNHVTRTWGEQKIEMNFNSLSANDYFFLVSVIDDTLIVASLTQFFVYNTTSGIGVMRNLGRSASIAYRTVNRVPAVDGTGYFLTTTPYIAVAINTTTATFLTSPDFGDTATQYVTTEDNVIYAATNLQRTFLNIFTYDINQRLLGLFKVPGAQDKLAVGYTNGRLIALGNDGNIYGALTTDTTQWYSAPLKHELMPTIVEAVDDSTIMMAGGKHYQLGFFTDEILFINTTAVFALLVPSPVPPDSQAPIDSIVPQSSGLTEGEIAAAVVVPVVVVAGVIALIVVLVQRRRRKSTSTSSVGLDARYGQWFIPFNQLTFGDKLGQGGSGQVFKGTWKNTVVALKVSMTQANQSVIRELELMMQLRPHPNVVQLLGFSVHPETDSVILVIEFCEGGSLDNKLYAADEELSLQTSVQWLAAIAKGLNHLHSNNVVHRDVAARNVLLNRNEPKLTDFGMSRIVEEHKQHGTTKSELGPIRWMSPESLKDKDYSVKSDVWSFGILMFEVIARQEPHNDADPIEVGRLIRDSGLTPVIPSTCHPQLATLMKQCWQMSPESRPTVESLIKSLESLK